MALDPQIRLALFRRRRELGLSQAQLADRLGVSQGAVSFLERGRYDPSLTMLDRWARAVELHARIVLESEWMAQVRGQ